MKKILALTLALAPFSAFAQQITDADGVVSKISKLGDTFVILLISFSVIWIIVNVVRYLIAGGEEDRKKGGMAILWGVVGLFVILSIWGLVAILTNTFSTDNNVPTNDFPRVIVPPSTR